MSHLCPDCGHTSEAGAERCERCGSPLGEGPGLDPLGQRLQARTKGRYRVVRRLGSGGMAAVYEAVDSLDRSWAIKVLSDVLLAQPEMVGRFEREARTISRLRHPHIVQLHNFEPHEDLHFLVLEFVPGNSLKDQLNEGALQLATAMQWFGQVADALDYAHRQGVVHRDIKPDNVLIRPTGEAVLTDFGIARDETGNTALTRPGTALGTGYYMSPEQWKGQRVDGAADQYSLGVVMWEAVAGRRPFQGETLTAVMLAHLSEEVPALRSVREDIPEELSAAVARMLSKDPAKRFPSVLDAVRAAGVDPAEATLPTRPAYTTPSPTGASPTVPGSDVLVGSPAGPPPSTLVSSPEPPTRPAGPGPDTAGDSPGTVPPTLTDHGPPFTTRMLQAAASVRKAVTGLGGAAATSVGKALTGLGGAAAASVREAVTGLGGAATSVRKALTGLGGAAATSVRRVLTGFGGAPARRIGGLAAGSAGAVLVAVALWAALGPDRAADAPGLPGGARGEAGVAGADPADPGQDAEEARAGGPTVTPEGERDDAGGGDAGTERGGESVPTGEAAGAGADDAGRTADPGAAGGQGGGAAGPGPEAGGDPGGERDPPDEGPDLASATLRVEPVGELRMAQGERRQVTATLVDGSGRPLEGGSPAWELGDWGVARLGDQSGSSVQVEGVAPGTTALRVSQGPRTASLTVTVVARSPGPPGPGDVPAGPAGGGEGPTEPADVSVALQVGDGALIVVPSLVLRGAAAGRWCVRGEVRVEDGEWVPTEARSAEISDASGQIRAELPVTFEAMELPSRGNAERRATARVHLWRGGCDGPPTGEPTHTVPGGRVCLVRYLIRDWSAEECRVPSP